MAPKLNMHRNTVYGHPEWKKHQSPWRHGRQMLSIFSSGIVAALAPPVFLSAIGATFVTMINYGVLEQRFASWVPTLQIAITPFTLLAPVLALLLVFRTNASYQRFDEARKVWGSNVNRCRDLARQVLTYVSMPEDKEKKDLILRYLKAYPYFLKHHLTQGGSIEELANILYLGEVDAIALAQSRPIYVLQVISETINKCRVGEYERVAMNTNLTQFHDNVGACERLFKTPIPVAYTRLTSRVLMLWHLALPYGLWDTCRWLTAPATFMSAVALFYIEQVGVMIEEPFWILPLDSICSGIAAAIDGLGVAQEEAMVMVWGLMESSPAKTTKTATAAAATTTMHGSSPLRVQRLSKKEHIVLKINPSKAAGPRQGHSYSDMSVVIQRSPGSPKTSP